MGCERERLLVLIVLLVPAVLFAQTSGLGRAPRPDELKTIDIDILPDGRGLPAGSGTAVAGKAIYDAQCASCHGPTGREGPNDRLAGGQNTLASAAPLKTVGSFWPYATTLWDYIRRTMPFDRPRSLSAEDTYAVTAYVLFMNGIIREQDALSELTLPQVRMPNRDGFVPDARPDTPPTPPSRSSPPPPGSLRP
jgi:S-disulfanyl-L-cysteine oxidoreductase SoxD